MRFVLGGKGYELDFEAVAEAAKQVVPDDIDGRHKYYVVIGDRRIPVKQLFAEATGLRRAEFITDDAFRIFRKLGLEIHEFNSPHRPNAELSALDKPSSPKAALGVPDKRPQSDGKLHRFAVSLEADEDGFIVASCPQLPGCHSQGRSRQEAVRNIGEAIRGYITSMKHYGEEIPVVDWELVEVKL